MRQGAFVRQLAGWSEQPCLITMSTGPGGGRLRFGGILRAYYSLSSLHGWALVPPQQHGGFVTMRLTPLPFERAHLRIVVGEGARRRLRFAVDRHATFTLERMDALLTGPPRTVRSGRYLYVGGRRRPAPEPWMLQ